MVQSVAEYSEELCSIESSYRVRRVRRGSVSIRRVREGDCRWCTLIRAVCFAEAGLFDAADAAGSLGIDLLLSIKRSC